MLSSLVPSSVTAGGQGFSLLVYGDNFNMNSVVQWNGANRPTSYMSRTQLSAVISADDISSGADINVTVSNPFPVLTVSNPLSFRVINPLPRINALSPASAVAAGQGFTLTVSGMDFVPGCTVQWNGLSRPTSFIDRTRVTAAISAGDITVPGQAFVSVSNPGPVSGTSGAVQFSIENPIPSISYIFPNSAVAGTAGISLTINGTGFAGTSVVQWNGLRQNTLFVSPSSMTISVGANQIASAGKSSISVVNPAPGGGVSNSVDFVILPRYASLSALASGSPSSLKPGESTLLQVRIVPGSDPASTGISVSANLTSIGGASSQQLYDDGTHGDATAGDSIFSFRATVSAATSGGAKDLPVTVRDAQGRKAAVTIHLKVFGASRESGPGNLLLPYTFHDLI